LLGIQDIIGFHADNVAALRTAFEEAVEDYLDVCEKIGKSPEKPVSGKILLRVPPEIHATALIKAQAVGNIEALSREIRPDRLEIRSGLAQV
jgi:predicted HicB family RNase H-like nuclease